MDNSKNSAVVHSFSEKRKSTQAHVEIDGARRLLSMPTFSWSMAVQQILSLAGLDVSEALLADAPATSSTSAAFQLGHQDLKSLLTSSEADDGMGMDWAEFREKMTAAVYKKKYQISDNDFREVNALVADASDILGRAPLDVAEFHSAKERGLTDQISSLSREHEARVREMTDKQQGLVRDLTQRQQELDGVRRDNDRLSQEVVQKITEMRRETAESQDRIERQAEQRISTEIARVTSERDTALSRLRDEISGEVRDANERRYAVEGELKEIQAQIAKGAYVEAGVVRAIQERLDQANMAEVELHNQLLSMNDQLTREQGETLNLRNQLDALVSSSSGDKEQIRALEQRLRDVVNERLNGSTEFMIIQERLSISHSEIRSLSASNETLQASNLKLEREISEIRGAHQNLRIQGREYCNHLRSINDEANVRNGSLVKQLGQAKLMLGVVLVTGVGALVAMTLSMTGII